jgi:hypothetical protein
LECFETYVVDNGGWPPAWTDAEEGIFGRGVVIPAVAAVEVFVGVADLLFGRVVGM